MVGRAVHWLEKGLAEKEKKNEVEIRERKINK